MEEKVIELYRKTLFGKTKTALAISPDILHDRSSIYEYRDHKWKVKETGELYTGDFKIYEGETFTPRIGKHIIVIVSPNNLVYSCFSSYFRSCLSPINEKYIASVYIPENTNNKLCFWCESGFFSTTYRYPHNHSSNAGMYCDLSKYKKIDLDFSFSYNLEDEIRKVINSKLEKHEL